MRKIFILLFVLGIAQMLFKDSFQKSLREEVPKRQKETVAILLKLLGPQKTFEFIYSAGISEASALHSLSHYVGEETFKLFGQRAMAQCSFDKSYGCIHAVFTNAVLELGLESVSTMLAECKKDSPYKYKKLCVHGVGHGFFILSLEDIFKAASFCDSEFPADKELAQECYEGVFMENVIGEHFGYDYVSSNPQYLRRDEPLFPCSEVKSNYAKACYRYQPRWWLKLFGEDFQKVVSYCRNVPKEFYQDCVTETTSLENFNFSDDASKIKENCLGKTKNFSDFCLNRTAAFFFSSGEEDMPFLLCSMSDSEQAKLDCFKNLVDDIKSREFGLSKFRFFCSKIEPKYRSLCEI